MNKLVTALWVVFGLFYVVYFWVNWKTMILHPFELLAYGIVGAMMVMLMLRGGER